MGRNFLSNAKFIKIKDHTAAGTTDVVSDIVDTAGYRGVAFVTSLSTANATNFITVQQHTANQTTGMADLEGSKVSSGTTDEDLIVEIADPRERYLQVTVSRGASTTCESIWAVLYGKNEPVGAAGNSVAGTQIAELSVAPAEGTA